MAVGLQRAPAQTLEALRSWLAGVGLGAELDLQSLAVRLESTNGFSAENFNLDWRDRAGRRGRWAVRVGATGYRVYPQDTLLQQAAILHALDGADGIPVPRVLAVEPDPTVLGAPFFVMSYVPGRVAADYPSYHRSGWFAELAPHRRRSLWWRAVGALARLHSLEPDGLPLPILAAAGAGDQLEQWSASLGFYGCADEPVVSSALDWLHRNLPARTGRRALLWGDARLGNIVYADDGIAALLDWEMAGIGDPQSDLAWFLYLDRHLSEGIGAPRLPGLPTPAETVQAYQSLTGRQLGELGFFTVLAGLKLALITAAVTARAEETGLVPRGGQFPLHRNAVALLASTLEQQ